MILVQSKPPMPHRPLYGPGDCRKAFHRARSHILSFDGATSCGAVDESSSEEPVAASSVFSLAPSITVFQASYVLRGDDASAAAPA